MAKSTKSRPGKPKTKSTSLWVHKGKQLWCKKSGGKFFYYHDVASDPDGSKSLEEWLAEKDRITLTGQRVAHTSPGRLTVLELLDSYLKSKERLVASGKMTAPSFRESKAACQRVQAFFGDDRTIRSLIAEDFELLLAAVAKTMSPVSQAVFVARVKAVFNWAKKSGLYTEHVYYGDFAVSAKTLDRDAPNRLGKVLSRESILTLLKHADKQWRAMIYLAINCGYGPADLGTLRIDHLDGSEWLRVPRSKTGAARRAWLWPETRKALKDWLAVRPQPNDAVAHLVFFTTRGFPWVNDATFSPVAGAFTALAKKHDVKHHGFYGLRHTFRTIADESLDIPACQLVMGHKPSRKDINSTYSRPQNISDERVRRVCEVVRNWLLPPKKAKKA